MTAEEIVGIVSERQLELSLAQDGQLCLRGPEEEKTDALLDVLKVFRVEVAAYLKANQAEQKGPAPRRIVLVGLDGEPASVVAETRPEEMMTEFRKHVTAHPGREVACEWHGPRGWTRFLRSDPS